ncbi:MAG: Gfo/Idh/MocA family oxidoreductase [Planctomycetota bacterium]
MTDQNAVTDKAHPGTEAQPVGFGLVGTGAIARILLPMLKDSPCRFVAVTDLDQDAAQAFADDMGGLRVEPSLEALASADDVEAVFIATPPSSHRALIEQCVALGKHVLCEKPLTLDPADADALRDLEAQHPELKLGCCSARFRCTPAAELATAFHRDGSAGPLRHVRVRASTNLPGPADSRPTWRNKPGMGGQVSEWCVYELEWLRGVLGGAFDPVSVHAVADEFGRSGTGLESGYQVTVTCESGAVVQLTRIAEIGPRQHAVELRWADAGLDVPFAPDAADLGVYEHRIDGDPPITTTELESAPPDWGTILTGPLHNLARAIRIDEPVLAPIGTQGVVQRVIRAIYASAESGQAVEVPASNAAPANI